MNTVLDIAIDAPTIEVTDEYSVFKTLEGNRKISETHVKNLVDFISKRNLLKYNPILVNENFEVVDGQHRLAAAKVLGLPIYFIMGAGLSYQDVGILNACSDDWEFQEYLNNYIQNNHEEYIKIENFKIKHNLKLKKLYHIFSTEQKKIFDECFKIGTFVVIDDLDQHAKNLHKIEEIIKFLESVIVSEDKKFIYGDNMWKALWALFHKDEAELERMKEKLSMKFQSVRHVGSWKEYYKLFKEIYNFKAKKRI